MVTCECEGGIDQGEGLVCRLPIGAQVPVWFCIACPIVLGLLAPFVFNLGLTAVAEAVCQHYSLPDDQCNELWCARTACIDARSILFMCKGQMSIFCVLQSFLCSQ